MYGPDVGLAAERAQTLVTAVLGPDPDPFRLAEPTAQAIANDPALLMDEAAAMSLTGGRRVVRVQRAGDATTGAFKAVLESRKGSKFIAERDAQQRAAREIADELNTRLAVFFGGSN